MTPDERAVQCSERELRARMTDAEFWQHVLGGEPDDDWGINPSEFVHRMEAPCIVCGEHGPCGYDSEGRSMIHVEPEDSK